MRTIARYSIGEAVRRRVFTVVVVLTVAFLGLFALGCFTVFDEVDDQALAGPELVEEEALTGGTLTGLGMFVTFFLAVVLAVFMTMSTARGDADRGVLQALVVRPLGRSRYLLGRLLAAVAVASGYTAAVYGVVAVVVWVAGGWTPDNPLSAGLSLIGAVAIVTCVSVLGSVHLGSTATGIASLMVFGAGLTAGLLGQIGEAIDSERLAEISGIAVVLLPFEALYQGALHQLTSETRGITQVVIELGPFGGAESVSAAMLAWSAAYALLAIAAAVRGFGRMDL